MDLTDEIRKDLIRGLNRIYRQEKVKALPIATPLGQVLQIIGKNIILQNNWQGSSIEKSQELGKALARQEERHIKHGNGSAYSHITMQSWEYGKKSPKISTLVAYSELSGIAVDSPSVTKAQNQQQGLESELYSRTQNAQSLGEFIRSYRNYRKMSPRAFMDAVDAEMFPDRHRYYKHMIIEGNSLKSGSPKKKTLFKWENDEPAIGYKHNLLRAAPLQAIVKVLQLNDAEKVEMFDHAKNLAIKTRGWDYARDLMEKLGAVGFPEQSVSGQEVPEIKVKEKKDKEVQKTRKKPAVTETSEPSEPSEKPPAAKRTKTGYRPENDGYFTKRESSSRRGAAKNWRDQTRDSGEFPGRDRV